MNVQLNKSAFDFLGFSLTKCSYLRTFESGRPVKLFVVVNNVNEKQNKIVELNVRIEITFENETTSKFDYLSQFIINDRKWYETANKENQNLGISNLFSLCFPYIRASVSAITNDSFGEIFLPVINVLKGDITKGVTFLTSLATQRKKGV